MARGAVGWRTSPQPAAPWEPRTASPPQGGGARASLERGRQRRRTGGRKCPVIGEQEPGVSADAADGQGGG
eukprot:7027771-Prymnesium_polylepis.1